MITYITEVSRTFYTKWGKEIVDHPKAYCKRTEFTNSREACNLAREISSKNFKADIHVFANVDGEIWWMYTYKKGKLAYHNENITW